MTTALLTIATVALIVRGVHAVEHMDASPLHWVRRERSINACVMLGVAGCIIVALTYHAVAAVLAGR